MRDLIPHDRPALLLAPMQDITDLPFMRVLDRFGGGPDLYITEYFRVHSESHLDRAILRSIDGNPTGKPISAQMIGQSIPDLVRTARALEKHHVAAIDLNLGCPAPIVCRKDAGGGLLRNRDHLDAILGRLREAISGRFTVKTRLGFHKPEEFEALLELFTRHHLDALSVHGRTVQEGYRTPIHPEWIRAAVERLTCPVFANGNVVSVATGLALLRRTGAAGLMIGRGAIRNPWLFQQLRDHWRGQAPSPPSLENLYHYVQSLYQQTTSPTRFDERKHVQKMKKYMIFIAQGIGAGDAFEHVIRRVKTPDEFWEQCQSALLSRSAEQASEPPRDSKVFCSFETLHGAP